MNKETLEILGAIALIYQGLMYFLPEKHAKKLKPIGRWLKFLCGTPGGFKRK